MQLGGIHNILSLQVTQKLPQILEDFLLPARHRPISLDEPLNMTQNNLLRVVFHIRQRLNSLDLDPGVHTAPWLLLRPLLFQIDAARLGRLFQVLGAVFELQRRGLLKHARLHRNVLHLLGWLLLGRLLFVEAGFEVLDVVTQMQGLDGRVGDDALVSCLGLG